MGASAQGRVSVGSSIRAASVQTAASTDPDTASAFASLQAQLAGVVPALLLIFHSPRHAPDEVARLAHAAFPGACTVGCTTAGEVNAETFTRGGMSAIAFGGPARASAVLVPTAEGMPAGGAPKLVAELVRGLRRSPVDLAADRHLFVTLTDGLIGGGEALVAALADVAPRIELVGGSAGDDDRLGSTFVWLNGVVASGATVVVLVEPGVPFTTFAVHHFEATERRCVITDASPATHRVHTIDGHPAARRFAEVTGVGIEDLGGPALAPLGLPRQFAFRAAGTLYMRGLLGVDGDDLILGGALEEGMVVRVAEAGDLLETTRAGVDAARTALGGPPQASLQFHCVGRRMQCPPQALPELHAAASGFPVAGFSTLGEQFGPFQVNYTLAGVHFGQNHG